MHEQGRVEIETDKRLEGPLNQRTILIIFLVIIAGLAILFAPQILGRLQSGVSGDVLKVPNDYPTIQAAIDAAQVGDTIQVKAGIYKENLTINKPVSLVAESFDENDPTKNHTTLDGAGKAFTILIPAGLAEKPTIRGFVIRNSADGILVQSEALLEYNYFHSAKNLASYQQGGGGINRHNVYFLASDNAIRLSDMDHSLLIENNRILYSINDGIEIQLQNASDTEINIGNNMILGNREDGIQLVDVNQPNVKIQVNIAYNLIASNKQAGIGIVSNAKTVEDYSGTALTTPVHVFNNTFYGNEYGISGGGNLVTFNNIIANSLTRGVWNVQGDAGTAAVVAYSLFYNNTLDIDQSNQGAGIILGVDPLFEAEPNPGPDGTWSTLDDDFSGLVLRSNSPAIDQGVAQYTTNQGELVPPTPISGFTGSAPDLGWREAQNPTFTSPTPTLIFTASPTLSPTVTAVTPISNMTFTPRATQPPGSGTTSTRTPTHTALPPTIVPSSTATAIPPATSTPVPPTTIPPTNTSIPPTIIIIESPTESVIETPTP